MVPDRQKVRTDGRTEWTDGRRQNYIPPTSSGDNKRGEECSDCHSFLSFSVYCLSLAFEHYQQVYIVHSGLQDESLQVTISKLP